MSDLERLKVREKDKVDQKAWDWYVNAAKYLIDYAYKASWDTGSFDENGFWISGV